MKIKFKIEGLDCANCARELEEDISKIDGVEKATVNFITQKIELTIDENRETEILANVSKVIKNDEPDATFSRI